MRSRVVRWRPALLLLLCQLPAGLQGGFNDSTAEADAVTSERAAVTGVAVDVTTEAAAATSSAAPVSGDVTPHPTPWSSHPHPIHMHPFPEGHGHVISDGNHPDGSRAAAGGATAAGGGRVAPAMADYAKHHGGFRPDKMYHRAQYPQAHFERHVKLPDPPDSPRGNGGGGGGSATSRRDWPPELQPRTADEDFLDKDSPSRRKRKHSSHKRKFYNYKLLFNTLKEQDSLQRKETEFYAWIFGATMLALGSFTTATSCFIFCFCGERWRKRRLLRRFDKRSQYERVDSVSSMVETQNHRRSDAGLPETPRREAMDMDDLRV